MEQNICQRMEFTYKKGAKSPFWEKIKGLLQMEIEKELKNPFKTMQQIVQDRRAIVVIQRKESGTVQMDSELDQNSYIWIE